MENQVKKGIKRNKLEQFKGVKFARNMVSYYRGKERNDLSLSKKILNIIAERDAALLKRNKALEEREAAIEQRNLAMKERDEAVLECDNALIALQRAMKQTGPYGTQLVRKKKLHHCTDEPHMDDSTCMNEREMHVVDTLKVTLPALEAMRSHHVKQLKDMKSAEPISCKSPRGKQASKDMKHESIPSGQQSKNGRVDNELGSNQVSFDESMPAPGCSCTGILRYCYKWGNGGWQSSCCTTTMSQYPLPRTPYRRYGRMGGRKMSGGVFTRLLNQLASEGNDLSFPVDLKDHWSKHGTNRYITIK